MMRVAVRGLILMALLLAGLPSAQPPSVLAQEFVWIRQFGTTGFDDAQSVAVDSVGNVYVAGSTSEALPGQTSAGFEDVYVRKYDANGTEVWTRQFGSALSDQFADVAVDGTGNVYVAGRGTLPGQTSAGGADVFVRKYDANGTEVWTRQFGTSESDEANGVAVDGVGNVYVAGFLGSLTEALPGQTPLGGGDAFVRKYDANGTEVWTRQFGTTAADPASAVAVDGASNVYVAGRVEGTLPGQTSAGIGDAFVRKYDANGAEVWTRQFGTGGTDDAFGVAADGASNVYVAGRVEGALPGQTFAGGVLDAFARKYDANGTEVWTRQFGTAEVDEVRGVAADRTGNVYLAGNNRIPDPTGGGFEEAFVRKYDLNGAEAWSRQFGTDVDDRADAVAVDGAGNVYLAGATDGSLLGQTSIGLRDAFVAKLAQPGAPSPTPTPPPPSPPSAAPPVLHDERYFPETGFRIDDDAILGYFNARGQVDIFGFPVSRTFTLLGCQVQVFQRQVAQVCASPALINLLDPDIFPFTRVAGSTFPAVDEALKNATPQVGAANYPTAILDFVRANAPDTFEGVPVNFGTTFFSLITPAQAGTSDPGLLGLINLEAWGAPISRPMRDPNNPDFVYQRFQRGIMHHIASQGVTRGILLADYLKQLVRDSAELPPDLRAQAQAQGSRFFAQYCPGQPGWLCRPGELPGTDLTFAFEQG